MNNYVDYKATIWFRIPIVGKEENIDKVLQLLKEGLLPAELYNTIDDLDGCEIMHDTEECLSPSENNNQATIEVYKNDSLIWDNGEDYE